MASTMFLARFLALCFFIIQSAAVPPEECFANFRWDDCGKSPEPVIYYWKPASRCEVGTWRGCLPNPNMFKTEFECSDTCIFNKNEFRQKANETFTLPADSVKSLEIEKEDADLIDSTQTTALEDIVTSVPGETLASSVPADSNEAITPPNAMVDTDELSPNNATDTMILDETLPSNKVANVEDESLASNDGTNHDENILVSNDTLVTNVTLASNENLDANETIPSKNTSLADDTPASDTFVPNETGVGSNETAVHDQANEQENVDNKPKETEGRSRLASYLKGH